MAGGIRVIAAFEHSGPARILAHHLKYRGMVDYAELVADVVAPRVPRAALVPVPRARSRLARYGIDPASVLASRLSRRLEVPVIHVLDPPIHSVRRAGGDHRRSVATPRLRKRPLEKLVLVDDVMTTGATLEAAVAAIGSERVRAVVVANAVPEKSQSLRSSIPGAD